MVLTHLTKLSFKDLAVFTPCSPAWGHCRQMIILLSESEAERMSAFPGYNIHKFVGVFLVVQVMISKR